MAIGSMWAWDNPVPRAQDARGRGYAPAEPVALAEFCAERALERVQLAAPWAADEGAVGAWFAAAAAQVGETGAAVTALGGDPGWIDRRDLAVTWATTALHAGGPALEGVHLDVEPWALPAWPGDAAALTRRWLGVLDDVRGAVRDAAAGSARPTVGADTPWWLGSVDAPDEPGTLLDAVLRRVDRVVVVAFSDHADGPDGIVALAAPAVAAATTAGVPWAVGVETDTPQVAGGAGYTFYDEGADVLEREAAIVAQALGAPGCVCVEHHRAWRRLAGLDG